MNDGTNPYLKPAKRWHAMVFVLIAICGGAGALILQHRRRLKLQAVDNVENERALSFPQRHWLLLCVCIAILSPLVVTWISAGVREKLYRQSKEHAAIGVTDIAPPRPDGSSSSSDTVAKDTSYHVATPPQH